MARLGARIRKGTMETMKALGTAAVARSLKSPVVNVAQVSCVPGMLQSPTVGQGLNTTNGNMVRLGDVCHILNGYAFRSEKYVCSGVRIIRIANVQKGYVEDSSPVFYPLDNNELYKYELFEDDLLMSLTGNVGRVALLQKEFLPAALNQRVACLRIKDETVIGKRFLFNFLNSDYFETKCIESSKGVAQKNMSTEWLKNYKVPLFSFEEQKKISSELDKISHLIALRKRQLSKLDELVKSRFVEMFGSELEQGRWPMTTVGSVAKVCVGVVIKPTQYYQKKGVRAFRSLNIGEMCVKDSDWVFFSENGHSKNQKSVVHKDDVLVVRSGAPGTACVVPERFDGANAVDIIIARPDTSSVDPTFLAMFTNMPHGRNQIKNQIGGAAQQHYNVGGYKSLNIIAPPLALQREFAAFVEKVDKLEFKAKASLEKLETLKKAMMQKYFN